LLPSDPAQRRYVIRTLAFMVPYVAVNIAAMGGAFDDRSAPGSYGLGLAVAAPIAGQLWATLALMRDADEFVRALTAKRFIIASGVAMALFSAWGMVESYGDAPHVPGWGIYPLFWMCFAIAAPFVRTTR
jgi:putative oxidoreductase